MHRNKILCFLSLCILPFIGIAQTHAGLKGGIFTFDVNAAPIIIMDEGNSPQYEMAINKTKIGVHVGFFVLAELGPVFIEPEISFHTHSVDYTFENLQDPNEPVLNRDESYNTLDFPILAGFKVGPVRFGGGIAGHLFLNSNSDILDLEGYEQNFETITWGWQAVVGLDTWKFHLEAKYEGNFENFGSHISFYGNSYSFDAKPSRILVSIGISF